MARLALERYIQTWVETIRDSGKMSKFFRLSYSEQIKWIAMLDRESFPNSAGSIATIIENADNGVVYKVAEKFGEHLHRTNLNIPISVLPRERQTIYIQFPKGISFQSQGHTFDHAIVDIGSPDQLLSTIKSTNHIMYRICAMPAEEVDGSGYYPSIAFLLPKEDSPDGSVVCKWAKMDIDDSTVDMNVLKTSLSSDMNPSIVDFLQQHPTTKSIPTDIIEFCLKVLLYINTGDPDLQPEAKRYPCATNPEKYIRHLENHCPFTILNLGYGFHERHRHVDSTMVTGHFRWQPYGPKLSKVKLIWIDEHARVYKNKEEIT